jgi:hypothetical protein
MLLVMVLVGYFGKHHIYLLITLGLFGNLCWSLKHPSLEIAEHWSLGHMFGN